ncbi:zinc-binding oxidoreductase-like protein ToxD [Cucurbitaria berberidis CBS 394.84]|uniref:Zinc-binding oxidoreductase-like protein ToxD n=1 Tax=Cucurbitaria berberidis CBS 394.84 TaxID=1168544 RepID=A0A9P4GHL3_9PLEO|nr:zinc-binding oxidoreductase-like protein ToxD [Cucurbitaria berberidis CBS 394.84]KAF1846303.1 zinc-binding oxidoreductase-like protein ToxD [Cucurbitaria berberidis CBS 394.84]
MKEVKVSKGPTAVINDVPLPEPGPDQLVIQVIVSGSNPKDWKYAEWIEGYSANAGDDIAGVVHSVGSNVWEFKPGDRVASFHEMQTPGGSFAEYAVGWQHTTIHLPKNVSFEEAATLPLAALTAAIGLHTNLGLPDPWTPTKESIPLVVYGGAGAVGAFVIKLARLANIHPIITVAGRGEKFVEGLIDRSKGDTIVDYRKGDEAVVQGIKDALKGAKLNHAYDAVAEHNSHTNILKVLEPNGNLTLVLPNNLKEISDTVNKSLTSVGEAHKADKDYAYVAFRYIARALAEGSFTPHPYEVIPGGLEGVQTGLENLRDGKASGVKYVFKIGEVKEKL